jgi:hypothetical protein
MNITAIIICIGLVGIIAAIALLGRWAAKNLDEANDAKHPADEAETPICAWCHPGIDHAAGHGICQRHAEELSAKADVASQSGPLE